MSTYVYLVCEDHSPPIRAVDESGQHLHDLPQLRADIANRDSLVAAHNDDMTTESYFRRNTIRFLVTHPHCRLSIVDEHGVAHSLTDEESPAAGRETRVSQEDFDDLASELAEAFHDVGTPIALGLRDQVAGRLLESTWFARVRGRR